MEYNILEYIDLYSKQINNVIRLSFEYMSYIFKRPLNNMKNKNMYPAVTSLYNLQVIIFNKKLENLDPYCEIGNMVDRSKSISPKNVEWFEQLQYSYWIYFESTLSRIAQKIDNEYHNIYDDKLYNDNLMSDYFYNKEHVFAYDISFLNKSTFSAVLRNVILQFYCLIHDMYNKVYDANDDNDVNEAKRDFIKKMSNMMNNLLLLLRRYSRNKKISNIITNEMKVLISVLNKRLQLGINSNILLRKLQ